MNEPIFILGCHRSGTSVIAGLLHEACGVHMGELMPPTLDNPLGYFEALGVVNAHRDLLFQMERDWTCPPAEFDPDRLDLSSLAAEVAAHQQLPDVWAMKDPRSMFLLRAWAHLGVERVRLVGVVRSPADTIRSIEKRDGIRQDRAEAIVDAYLARLAEIAERTELPLVHFSSDAASVLRQVRDLAASLDLEWDEKVAETFFHSDLVRNQSPLRDSTPTFDRLVEHAVSPGSGQVPTVDLRTLHLSSEPDQPLETHLGVRYARQRHELWDLATFSTSKEPHVVEILSDGARLGGGDRPGVARLDQLEVSSPLMAGAALLRRGLRPDGVIAHGLLTGCTMPEVQFFFQTLYVNTQPFAELVLDVPAPSGQALLSVIPAPPSHPRPSLVREIASGCGWDHVLTARVSPGRSGIVFRKRVNTDTDLVPVVTDLIASLSRIQSIDERLASVENGLDELSDERLEASARAFRNMRRRAESAERDLQRLRNRRSVRVALLLASPFARPFRMVRAWKSKH